MEQWNNRTIEHGNNGTISTDLMKTSTKHNRATIFRGSLLAVSLVYMAVTGWAQCPTISCPNNITMTAAAGTCGAVVTYTAPTATNSCACPSTPSGFGAFSKYAANGNCYALSTGATNWIAARDACIAAGGHLATIATAGENTFVKNLLSGSSLWIGFTDGATEGTWLWVTNESVTYTNWGAGEPNNSSAGGAGGEDCAELRPDGFWNDLGYTYTTYRYVLEIGINTMVQTAGLASGSTFPLGTTTNTFQVTHTNGQTATCSFTVTVNGLQAPQAIGNITLGPVCTANGSALLPDANITASTCYPGNPNSCNLTGGDGHESWRGRLFNCGAGVQAWASTSPFTGSWWQVDLGSVKPVNGVSTQIRGDCCPDQRVVSYNVQYSADGTTWNAVAGGPFSGNPTAGTCAVVTNIFSVPYQARYVRIFPLSWGSHLSMRAEVISIPCTPAQVTASAEMTTLNCPTCVTGIRWYDAATGGTLLGSGQYITRTISSNTTIYAESVNGAAVSPSRTAVTLKVNAPTATVSGQSNISCYAGNNGSIIITAGGSTGPYQFSIHNGGTTYISGSNPYTFSGLNAGTYYPRVKDALGCESPACEP
jgi:hypothetical protein